MSGQTLTDRIAAAQYSLTGSEVSRAVCKSTTHEQTAPKKKHLEYLIQATQESNVNVPQMADTLFERAGNASWVVVFKALVTTHHLMVHGNERFIQFLASRNTLFNLSNFLDKTGSHGYDMSTFIRRYSRYLNEKAFAYRQMAFDFGRVKKGADGVMRTMSVEKLLKGMPTLQSQIDALLEFDVHPQELNNGVINACFLLLFKDLIKLYACYNDGIINLLEKFFQMKRSQCKDGLEIYKRFLTRMTQVSEFFKIAEQVGIDKNDIPELTQAPESLLESLETHLNTLEGKKPSPTKDATANNSSPAAAAPAKPAAPTRPGPPAKPPPPSITPTPTTATSNALDDGFLLDLDPMSSSSAGGTAAASSTTAWGDLLAEATPAATDGASEALLAEEDSAAADADADADAAAAASAAPAAATPTAATAAAAAAPAPAPAPASLPVSAPPTTAAAEIDLFGDAFAPSPGDGPAAVAAGPATDAFGGSDPFATTEGSVDIAPGLDLFAMRPADTGAAAAAAVAVAITPPTSSEAPTIAAPIAAPAAAPAAPTPSSTTTTTTTTTTNTTDNTTTESAAAPALDIFGDMFDSMPEQSPTTESKAATTPSVDLFGADLPAVSRGPSPLPELAPVGDIVTGEFSSLAPAPVLAPAPAPAPAPEPSSPPKAEPAPVIDLLDSFSGPVEEVQSSAPGGPGDDLLGGLMSPSLTPAAVPPLAPALAPLAPAAAQNDLLESGFDALGSLPSPTPPVPAAVSAVPILPAAAAAEPATTTPAPSGGFDASMFDGLGDLLMPAITPQSTGGSTAGSIGTPAGMAAAPPATPPPTKTIGGDLDSSLANLIGDLGVKKKDPQSEKKLTGGANWMPKVAPTSWGTPGAPMAGAAPGAPGAPGAAPPSGAILPPMGAQPGFGMPPAAGPGAPMMQPMMGQPLMGQPLMRTPFTGAPGAAAPGAPLSPGPASQSPKKPKDPLAELDLKDFL
uniref:clathrin coat assembly protein AP180-like isoform X2 n=1 Tax=Centroberyx gerrardi TaxID=166262 RepID=UPI003AABD59B